MQRLGRAATAVLQAHRVLTAEAALQGAAASSQLYINLGVACLQVRQCQLRPTQGLVTVSSTLHSRHQHQQWPNSIQNSIRSFSEDSMSSSSSSSPGSSSLAHGSSADTGSTNSSGTKQASPLSASPADAMPTLAAAETSSIALPNRRARRKALWATMKEASLEAVREAWQDAEQGSKAPSTKEVKLLARQAARQRGHSVFSVAAAVAQDTPKAPVIEGICRRTNIQLGWKKLDFVLRMVRRSYVDDAMAQLSVNPKTAAKYVMHAIANARNNAICAGGDPAKLWVAEAFVTKGRYEKGIKFMGRGYSGKNVKRHSHLNVKVKQLDGSDPAAAKMLRRSARQIAPLMMRQHWDRADQSSSSRLRLWSGRKLQQRMQSASVL